MKALVRSFLILAILAPSWLGMAQPAVVTVALLSKVIADVSIKESSGDWQKAKKGGTLADGDIVRTGEKSMAIIKFMDNSLVRVRELSEVKVTGALNGANFQKSVDVRSGVVGFTVQKQRPGEEFKFTSPTSVASIRGTGGLFLASPTGDTLTVLDGAIVFLNLFSNQNVTVAAGTTGISLPNGTLSTHPSTEQERSRAENALRGDNQKSLEFELRDGQGRSKHLRIEYRD